MNYKFEKLLSAFMLTIQACCSQVNKNEIQCDRRTIHESLNQKLPKGICIPMNYTIDDVQTNLDFDRDKKSDVVLRYGEYPLKTGSNRIYALYKRTGDTTFVLKKEIKNIMPPYLKNVYAAITGTDTLAHRLATTYPYDLKIEFVQDTIKLSHLIPDYYGKTYIFVFNADNWYLKYVTYWIGGLDERDIEQMDLSSKLLEPNVLETKRVDRVISIDKFSLTESRRIADTEEKDYFSETYNLLEWSNKNK